MRWYIKRKKQKIRIFLSLRLSVSRLFCYFCILDFLMESKLKPHNDLCAIFFVSTYTHHNMISTMIIIRHHICPRNALWQNAPKFHVYQWQSQEKQKTNDTHTQTVIFVIIEWQNTHERSRHTAHTFQNKRIRIQFTLWLRIVWFSFIDYWHISNLSLNASLFFLLLRFFIRFSFSFNNFFFSLVILLNFLVACVSCALPMVFALQW